MEDACWVGLLSTQELRKGERALSHVSFSQCFLQQVPLPGSVCLARSHWDIFPHFQDYGHFYLDLCAASTYKEALGDRISRIRRDSHMSSSSNWYSKSFTLSNATKREKGAGACFAFQHLQERNRAFDWCLKWRG